MPGSLLLAAGPLFAAAWTTPSLRAHAVVGPRAGLPIAAAPTPFTSDSSPNVLSVPNNAADASGAGPPVLDALCAAATRAVVESTGEGGESSGSGRPEWGTWCDKDLLAAVRQAADRVGAATSGGGAWARLWEEAGGERPAATLRVAGGDDWELLLHLFSGGSAEGSAVRVRHADGVLSLLRPLVGSATVSKLRPSGELVGSPRKLAAATSGALLQIGGPVQEYAAAGGSSALLEVILRHPLHSESDKALPSDPPPLSPASRSIFYDREAPPPPPPPPPPLSVARGAGSLGDTLSGSVGGLEAQLDAIVRRVLASRADPAAARRLGISHVRGILLSGPPGCGKTLLARELARSLGAREPQVVNGPEILDKFVGEAEAKVRELFAPAEAEWDAAGDASALHVIILDEMDAIGKKRGAASGDASGVRDSVVNQLLSKMDGVVEAGNVLVVGLTNRPELLDEALLRPGRLEVQVEV